MGRYYSTTLLLLAHVSKIVSILLSELSDCPTTDTLLCYNNYPFLTVLYRLEVSRETDVVMQFYTLLLFKGLFLLTERYDP